MCTNHDNATKATGPVSLNHLHRRDIVRGLWSGSIVLAAAGATGCADTAAFFAPTDDQLLQMSAQAWEETKAQTPISRDAAANRRLQSIGPKLAAASGLQGLQWEFVVFESEEKNAWVLPNGKVGFYKGLMDFCENDSQAAAVLGHEVGHVAARHAALRAGQQTATSLALQTGGALLGSTVQLSSESLNLLMAAAGAGAQVGILLPFSRNNEIEADKLGVDYMHTAGYDVKQSVRLWEKMGAASTQRPTEWMSTHPNPETRVQELRNYINTRGYAVM
jgi:predicted Zn-dependent protease